MPGGGGHEHDLIYSLHIYACFLAQFSSEKNVLGKKIVVPCLDVIMIAFFNFNFIHSLSIYNYTIASTCV